MPKNPVQLPYNPQTLPRELRPFYIGMTEQEIEQCLKTLNKKQLSDLFAHLPNSIKFSHPIAVEAGMEYNTLAQHLFEVANKNNLATSFLGDGLPDYSIPSSTPFVCSLRGLTTAYTPYQPERCQGTLHSLWAYSSAMAMLTGFEAVNASLYDRSTCLFEALLTAQRLRPGKNVCLVAEGIYPGDAEVIVSQAKHTSMQIVFFPIDKKLGQTDWIALQKLLSQYGEQVAALAFPQINHCGQIEDFNRLAAMAKQAQVISIGIIDPVNLVSGGLLPPSKWGGHGVDLFVGEGQHLAIGPSFGGPGLGIYGIRYNQQDRNSIRATAGRFVGKGKDAKGNEAFALVLSTREQHIRREKANSNICSNQSFVATLVGASILTRGEKGMRDLLAKARQNAQNTIQELLRIPGVQLSFPQGHFVNEVAIMLNKMSAATFLQQCRQKGLNVGVDISRRVGDGKGHILISFYDRHTAEECQKLISVAESVLGNRALPPVTFSPIPAEFMRQEEVGLPNHSWPEVQAYYQKLNQLNVSPDDHIYPLGSCTMKYNPYINDWAASLPGIMNLHPQVPEEDAQGSLQILFEIQEMFKAITGLAAVTTQPVAGAQGELVGLKLFQAYHQSKGENRDIIIIPKSAHGTNPATASYAGIETINHGEVKKGIIIVDANEHGQIQMDQFRSYIEQFGKRIIGVMITNPNTSGIFETQFKEIAELVHSVGGLVYMDGANMNAVAGIVDLGKMGVDAVHNNLHKTWSIPHGGGGPGDGIVAVSDKLVDFLPGIQVKKEGDRYRTFKARNSIGSFHRHFGNFGHKMRCYAYLKALGGNGIKKMTEVSVLSANYLFHHLSESFPVLPENTEQVPRMHEFILTLRKETFEKIEKAQTPKALAIARLGKIFLDFGLHAPTVAFPEVYGMMFEPTETYSKEELDHFIAIVKTILHLVEEHPEVLATAPHFAPVKKIDEVDANKNLTLCSPLTLRSTPEGFLPVRQLLKEKPQIIAEKIVQAHRSTKL